MQCSQVEKRSHGSRKASSGSSSPPGPGGRVISSAGEMLLASWSSRSSGSSTCSPSSSGPCRAMSTARSGNLVALKECYQLCVELVETLVGSRDLSSGHNNWRRATAQKLARASIAQRLAGASYIILARFTTSWRQCFAAFKESQGSGKRGVNSIAIESKLFSHRNSSLPRAKWQIRLKVLRKFFPAFFFIPLLYMLKWILICGWEAMMFHETFHL